MPNKIQFHLKAASQDPEMRIAGNVYPVQTPDHPVIAGVVLKSIQGGDTWPGELPAGRYALSFRFVKKGKLELSAVTPADPDPEAEAFEATTDDERFGRVFFFVVSRS